MPDDVDQLVTLVQNLWPRFWPERTTDANRRKAELLLERFRKCAALDLVIEETQNWWQKHANSKEPNWDEIGDRLWHSARRKRRTIAELRDDEANVEREDMVRWAETYPCCTEILQAEKDDRAHAQDIRNWSEGMRLVGHYVHYFWGCKDRKPWPRNDPNGRGAYLGPPEPGCDAWKLRANHLECTHFHVRNLRTFGAATIEYRAKWLNVLESDAEIGGVVLESAESTPTAADSAAVRDPAETSADHLPF